jgi:tetratricopeptide (TPR) repeat protein
MARLRSLIIAIPILSVYFLSPAWTQEISQETVDAQRCNGELKVSAQEQIASCSALIDSRSFSGKTLAIIYSNRGIIWFEQSDYYKAVVDLGEAIALDPLDATSFYHRGLAKLKIGDASGKADIAKAEELNPQFRAAKSATPSLARPNRANDAASERTSNDSKKEKDGRHSRKEVSDHSKKEVSHKRGKAQRDEKGVKEVAERRHRGRESSDAEIAGQSRKKVAERSRGRKSSDAPVATQPPSGNFMPGIPLFGLGIGFGGFGSHH